MKRAPMASLAGRAQLRRLFEGDPRIGGDHATLDPSTGEAIAHLHLEDRATYDAVVERARAVQAQWQRLPAPKRGEIVRQIGGALREEKDALGALIAWEVGKIRAEGVGEVVEAIDIADFSVGLSRQLYGLSMHSERPQHRMFEQWHPVGTIGIITAFNFPCAVWAWNAMVAAVCGNAMVWKPSLAAPLVAIATNRIAQRVMRSQTIFQPEGLDPADLFGLVIGSDAEVGEALTEDRRLPLVSATGSCRMGRHVAAKVAGRLGRTLLELGGNNAIIVMADADLELTTRGVVFGAVGTAGQRCTSTRRLLCHHSVVDQLCERLTAAYQQVKVGDPLVEGTLMGPLISSDSVEAMGAALRQAQEEGCTLLTGGRPIEGPGHFVEPAIVRVPAGASPAIARHETFAPILYIYSVRDLDEAIRLNNEVDQGLSSAVFTDSIRAAERFLSAAGSDCGIANVNIGTSGAEIGGAFGGEKDTGGGRESGSDAWKAYMRRQTCTVNWGEDLPLAQGIEFG